MSAARPDHLVLIVGTATEIGKTWVTARLCEALRDKGVAVAARKPAQSFEPGDREADRTDAQLLATASGVEPHDVTPPHRWYPIPLAPPMAAEALGRPPVILADLVDELSWPTGTAVGLVETAGGVRSPLALDGDAVVLAARTAPDLVLVVADAGLGTIGAVRGASDALAAHRIVVHLNRFDGDDDTHRRNRSWLIERDGAVITTTISELAGAVVGR